MGLKAPKLSLILIAAVFALSCFGFTLFVWKSFGGPTPFQAHGYRFHVVFGTEASQMTSNADVRISGVSVGKVVKVEQKGQGEGADVLVELDPEYAPIPTDTRAIVRFKSLLGEAFVALTPGSRDAPPLKENGTLAATNIGSVQQVDEVLGTFDAPTRLAFTQFLRDFSKVLDGRSADVNAALGHLAPTAESARDLLVTLNRQKGELQSLISDSTVALGTIGDRADDLATLVSAGNEVFEATASQSESLTRITRALPDFLRDTRAALRVINAGALEARPVLRALRPAIPLVEPALVETARLAPVLRDTFDELDPVIDAAATGLPALDRILVTARPALKVLYVAGRELIPVADYLRLYRTDVISAVAKIAASVNWPVTTADGTTQRVLRALLVINDETPVNQTQRLGENRHNAYPRPQALRSITSGSYLRAFHCRNVGNPQSVPRIGGASPPCTVAPPLRFRGEARQYPHVELDGP
jgi:phospholipid/cholesterol/gamma-HCH transport system substrate-binding protein